MTDTRCLSHTVPSVSIAANGDANDANDWPKPISARRRARVQGRALRRLGVVDARSGCRRGGDADRARSRRLPTSCDWLTSRPADGRRVSGVFPKSSARAPDSVAFVSASRPPKVAAGPPEAEGDGFGRFRTASLAEGAHRS